MALGGGHSGCLFGFKVWEGGGGGDLPTVSIYNPKSIDPGKLHINFILCHSIYLLLNLTFFKINL